MYLGFTNLTLVGPTSVQWGFTGLQNLSRLRQDTTFWSSLWVTAGFIGGSIVGVVVLGYWLASLLMRARTWMRVVVGGVVVVSWMMPAVTAGYDLVRDDDPGRRARHADRAAQHELPRQLAARRRHDRPTSGR